MKEIKILKRVNKFNVAEKLLAYTLGNEFKISELKGKEINSYKFSNELLSEVQIIKNHIWTGTGTNHKSIIYEQKNFKLVDFLFSNYSSKESCFYARMFDADTSFACKINSENTILWKTKDRGFGRSVKLNKYFIHRSSINQLTTLNNQTGEELWTYTLPDTFNFVDFTSKKQTASISKILGIYKENIWLLISNGTLMALNIETGLQSAHIVNPSFVEGFNSERQQNIKKYIDKNNYGLFSAYSSDNVQLDVDKGVIFSFPHQCYAEVDLNDLNYPFTLWDIKHTLDAQKDDKPGFNTLILGSWEKNNVYVYDRFSNSNRFGVFDRATKEIRWSEYFEGEDEGWGAIQDLKYTSGYLYIHAKVDKSLHIYKLGKM